MDEIQRKLRLIDEQLARKSLHERIISTCPLVFVASGLIVGILIQSWIGLSVTLWAGLLVFFGLTAIACFSILRLRSANRYATAYLAFGCFVCLGAIRLTHFTRPEPGDIRHVVTDERKLATIRGSILTEPIVNTYPDWAFARFKPTDPTTSFYLNVTEIEINHGWEKVTGVVRVQVGEPVLDLKIGDAIQAYSWLDRFAPATNPGQFDTAEYLARRNIFVAVSVQSRAGITLRHRLPLSNIIRLKSRIRQAATNALLGDIPQDENRLGLLEALLLGYRRDIDSHTYQAFEKTGLLHLISLSGLHLGILVGIIWWLCKTIGFMKPARAVICAVAVGIFLLIVPPRAPTIRAAIICWVFCASILLRRHASPINTLSLAAIILLLLIRPTQLFEVGWQLSFASVLGIVLFTKRIEAFVLERGIPRLHGDNTSRNVRRVIVKLTSVLIRLLAVGLAAWLGSAGILLYHFHTITPLAFLWTVLVFPLVGAILILGFLKMILFFLLPTLSAFLGIIVLLISDVFIRMVELIARLDSSQILIGRVSLTPVILYYGIIIFVGFVSFRRSLTKHIIALTAVLTLIVYLGAIKWQRTYRDDFILSCLDVGHGQAILARLPDNTNVLFDAGSLHRRDIGSRIIVPYLEHTGINRMDAIVISHNDIDHINGIPEIVEHCHVKSIYANETFFDNTDTWGTATFLHDWMNERGLEIKRIRGDLELSRAANLQILWPDPQTDDTETLSDNDRSLVVLMEYAGTRILLCSDIEAFAQKELLERYPQLKADVVVVPHHGSATTVVPEFLKKLDARILICSCDKIQYERARNASDFMAELHDSGKLFYTFKDGAVVIRVNHDGSLRTERFMQ
ncbi:MAG: DNA internalization-related competence protein ComEC/Rec2 [Sedimentisphaerales bacterium]|nr:DNA internalization-related competence protein ComEC/Rec2 [Sedimentisphaerales bacterium]